MNGVCIVALALGNQTVEYEDGDIAPVHQTLVYFGPQDQISREEIADVEHCVSAVASVVQIFPAMVVGKGTLGPDGDRVVFTESSEALQIRDALIFWPVVAALMNRFEQHPNWISHTTGMQNLVYGDHIVYDRLAVWYGEERTTYPLVGAIKTYKMEG